MAYISNILCVIIKIKHNILYFPLDFSAIWSYTEKRSGFLGGVNVRIAGLQKMTLLDFPGAIACTVFLPGCNLRCPFCHNASLVLRPGEPPMLAQAELLAFLESRKGKLDGVCITGGEPTLHKDLPQLIRTIKEMGYAVKLDTNGSDPGMLRNLLDENLLDYVAMDIKNSPDRYAETCGNVDILPQVKESAKLLMEGSVPYEFRTTVCHPFHDEAAIAAIGKWLKGAKQYFLQGFVDSGDLIGQGMQALTPQQMDTLRQAALPYIPNTHIRGI